jgi:hypothetical protein
MKAAVFLAFLTIALVVYGQQENKQESPSEHHCQMMKHGEMAMGFSQDKTTHHFRLTASGGVIEVQTNDVSDTTTQDQIRQHLQGISKAFAQGDFSSPMMTHGKIPPGVPDMQRLKGDFSYAYVETDRGGKVLISTANSEALKAVHEFLRFQIEEHQTGDAETVQK